MTKEEFRRAFDELLKGWPVREQTKLFGRLLGYSEDSAAEQVRQKLREGTKRYPSGSDQAIIAYLRMIKARDGHLMHAVDAILGDEMATEIRFDTHKTAGGAK